MRYYRILDSFSLFDRWYLGTPKTSNGTEIDPRLFTKGRQYDGAKITEIPIVNGNAPLDFTLGSFDVPIMKSAIAASMQAIAPDSVQRIPVKIVGGRHNYEILNVLCVLEAINEQFSEISRWTAEDGQPNKIGQYFGIAKLVLNRLTIEKHHIFRLKDWELPLIVNEKIKNRLERLSPTGITFEELQTK